MIKYSLLLLIFVIALAILLYMLRSPRVIVGGYVKNLSAAPRSKSEAYAISLLEELTGAEFPTILPSWLTWKGRKMELDGYNEKLKLALEFSGPLHTKWTPTAEPYEKYFARIVKDVAKRKLCKRRGVRLIVLDMSLPRHHWRTYLASRLADYGMGPRPAAYIAAQKANPFRNKPLERELGLSAEWKAAAAL